MHDTRDHRTKLATAHPARRGTAIVPALLVVMLTATLSMIYLQLSLAKNKEQRVSVDSKRAFYMAEAGLAEAFNGLCLGKSGDVGTEDLPAQFANGLFFVTSKEEGQGRITLRSTGLCGAGRATLSIVVERQPDEIAARGFFGDQNMTVEPGALIDSYDSRLGKYLRPSVAAILGGLIANGARVGCNTDISVTGSAGKRTYIVGDAKPGQFGTLFRTANTTITGSTAPNTTSATMPAIVVPTYDSEGDVLTGKRDLEIKSGEKAYGTLHVGNKGELKIIGPAILVVDKLIVESGGELQIDARKGPIKLYVKEGIKIDSGADVTMRHTDPLGFNVSIPASASVDLDGDGTVDQPVTLDGTGSLFGTIYAPNTAVTLQERMEVFGAVTAQSLTVKTNTLLHYDRALSDSSGDLTGPPRFLAWRVVELPQVPLVALRFDALKALKKQGKTPKKSKDAHHKIGEDDDD